MVTRTNKDWKTGTETVETLFSGATLAVHWNSTRVMSDVWESLPYATVYNAATAAVEVVWHDGKNAKVDATPEVIDAANAWLLKATAAAHKAAWDNRVANAVADAHKVAVGKTATVVKGRKVAKGTTGTIIWVGVGKSYSYYDRGTTRVGLKDAAGTVHWTAASNVEVVNPDEHFDFDTYGPGTEPDHTATAMAAINAGNGAVTLFAGEDRLGFYNWFKAAALAAAA